MGLSPFSGSRDWFEAGLPEPKKDVNPNPYRFKVLTAHPMNGHLIAMVDYPDATNYEGMKLLFFKDKSPDDLKGITKLDPHFSGKRATELVPFARFEPTPDGMVAAMKLAKAL